MITGTLDVPLPAVLGDEGAGIVEEIGEGVTGVPHHALLAGPNPSRPREKVQAIAALREANWTVCALQDFFPSRSAADFAVGPDPG